MEQEHEIIAAATDILTRRYGGAQQLSEIEQLSGSGLAQVFRARVASNPFFQHRSVVIKHAPATGSVLDDAAFLREVVAYQFATSLSKEARPGPTLLGYDTEQRLIIISDSGDGETLADALERADAEGHAQILRKLGTALGRMHAGTADEEEAFDILFHRMTRSRNNAAKVQKLRDRFLAHRIRLGLELMHMSGIEPPREVELTAANIQDRLLSGGMRAFTPFDLSPDNIIYSEGKHHFLDYEWAGFRDVSFDVAFVVARFPMFLATQPFNAEATQAFIDAWVAEVKDIWPAVRNPYTLHARITAALVGWALSSITVLDPHSLSELLEHDEELAAEFAKAGVDAAEEPGDVQPWTSGDILRPRSQGPFSDEEQMVRRDLRETFESLGGFARTGTDPVYETIAEFADEMAARLR